MARQIIKLTEEDLHKIIRESVNRILKEEGEFGDWRDDYEAWKNFAGDKEEGNALLNKYLNRAKSEFGGDEKARIKALNKHMAANDAARDRRLASTDPKFLDWEKAWSRKYDAEHGINATDDSDAFDFEAEKAKAAAQRERRRSKPSIKSIGKETPQTPSKFSGKSPEEIEQMMRDMGFVK